MNSPRFVGQALAVCLSAALAFSPAAQVQSPSGIRSDSLPADSVVVWHREASQYRLAADLPVVTRVRNLVESAIEIRSPDLPRAKTARETLSEQFGTLMTEIASPPQYVWRLINGEWMLVCLTVTEFQIDFGRWGHVVVQTQDQMPVD